MIYLIKALVPVANFKWISDAIGGPMSLIKNNILKAPDVDEKTKTEAFESLREYSLDNIRATFAVREYIRATAIQFY
jgi:hypothetical protein